MKPSVAQENYARVTRQARIMLAARIKAARQQRIPIAIFWREKKWPIVPLCKGGSAQGDDKTIFLRPGEGRGNPKPSAYLLPWVEQFAKVITALWLCEEGKSFHRIRDIILGIRWLNEGILGTPAQGVHDLLPIHFERAAKTIAEAVRDKTVAYETARELALIADKLDDLVLSNSRIRFTNALNEPLPRRRDRTTNDLERDALYHCINSPLDDGERVLMEALRLHFAWGARTVMELNGIACLSIEEIAADKQQIVCSRSFKHAITTFDVLVVMIARFCVRAAEKLRQQQLLARRLSVFIRTSPFKPDQPYYERSGCQKLLVPSQDTRYLVAVSRQLLKDIFKSGYAYQKAGVQLDGFQSMQAIRQQDLFAMSKPGEERLNHVELMAAMYLVNQRFPKAVTVAATRLAKALGSANDHVSPRHATLYHTMGRTTQG